MRFPRVRLTVRRLMVAVALAGFAFAVGSWYRRSPYYRDQAARCAEAEQSHLRMAVNHERIAALYRAYTAGHRGSARYNDEQARLFARAAGAERAAAKRAGERGEAYRQAARFPWLLNPPDDPAPGAPGRGLASSPGKSPRR
jgi:hypothetical protein